MSDTLIKTAFVGRIREQEPSAYRLVRRSEGCPAYYEYILQGRLRWEEHFQDATALHGEDWVDLPTVIE